MRAYRALNRASGKNVDDFKRLTLRSTLVVSTLLLPVSSSMAQQATIIYNFRGENGTCCSQPDFWGNYGDNGHDGRPGRQDFVLTDSDRHIQSGQGTAILINVSGGDGADGRGSSDYHWGGNGGYGRIINYTIQNSSITSAGRGIDLYSAGGQGGFAGYADGPNGGYGIGGNGGPATVTLDNVSLTANGFGVAVQSWGGNGRDSALVSWFGGEERDAGWGGNGGGVSATLGRKTVIVVTGPGPDDVSAGVGLISQGGNGGTARHIGDFGGHSNAGRGGAAGSVSFTSDKTASIAASGDAVYGVSARSLGGNASGGNGSDTAAAAGGNAGSISIVNAGSIITQGNKAFAIFAASRGGQGGNGGGGSWGSGHRGERGGSAGAITISNSGTISTGTANRIGASAILAEALGGQGGSGGPGGSFGSGGDGGQGGGSGQAITISNSGLISTLGNEAIGIVAYSAGGGGGRAGTSNGIIFVGGGNGGNAGNGGNVSLDNSGSISTAGDHSDAVVYQSIGGGGGIGGDAFSTGVITSMAIGGRGGTGGNGATVSVNNSGKIATSGANARGMTLQSIGGGGGSGGSATAVGVGVGLNATLAQGGDGNAAGSGGSVSLVQTGSGSISTFGDLSHGILAQSIGGGGGAGGFANSRSITIAPQLGDLPSAAVTLSVSQGGSGGAGGDGGMVVISNAGTISTEGAQAMGVTAQSIGRGGGNGGAVVAPLQSPVVGNTNLNLQVSVRQGGDGGNGGQGALVQVSNQWTGSIATVGAGSIGILAQSIGGGGGNGGTIQQNDAASFNSIVGSPQALPGLLDKVVGWLEKGPQLEISKTLNVSAAVTIGADGGIGGSGGRFDVNNSGAVTTEGNGAAAIAAQSIGGGGGNAGTIDATGTSSLLSTIDALIKAAIAGVSEATSIAIPSFNVTHQTGGNGGAGGDGGGSDAYPGKVTNSGSITTRGNGAAAILAQSIGGGGGSSSSSGQNLADAVRAANGDNATSEAIIDRLEQATRYIEILATKGGASIGSFAQISTGGQNGAAGNGGAVLVDASSFNSLINTHGSQSPGIIAQSIGGGGGSSMVDQSLYFGSRATSAILLGGSGLLNRLIPYSNGGSTTILQGGNLTTAGAGSPGLIAQTIGGGGGLSLLSLNNGGQAITGKNLTLSMALGGAYGTTVSITGGDQHGLINGGAANITNSGQISTTASLSPALVAQSIGGGGGLAIATTQLPTSSVDLTLGGRVPASSASGLALAGNGGAVTVNNSGPLSTKAVLSFGILAQSIGGGGGAILLASDGNPLLAPMNVTFGANAPLVGSGGNVTLNQDANGSLTTAGQNAHAIVAQSIALGGGVAGLALQPGLTTLKSVQGGALTFDNIAAGSVTIDTGGLIMTAGNGAIGVLAQSIGGSGGLTGDQSAASYGRDFIQRANLQGGSGAGGTVSVNLAGSAQIRTSGANAAAIVAMSVGGSGVFRDGTLYQYGNAIADVSNGGNVTVTLQDNAMVAVTGMKSAAIVAVSSGTARGGQVNVTLGNYTSVLADQSSGTGILALAPGNSITISNKGFIQAATAIATSENGSVSNDGTVAGDVLLTASGTFNNNGSGQLYSGTSFEGHLNNAGILNPGGPNRFLTTRISGTFNNSGIYAPDLDFGNHNSDFLSVSGASNFAGTLTPVLHNPLKNEWLGIGHFATTQTNIPTAKSSSPLFSYVLSNNKGSGQWQDPLVAVEANFKTAALPVNADRAALTDHLQELWEKADRSSSFLFDAFTGVQSVDQYNAALNGVAHDGQFARAAQQMHASFAAMNRLMSCPQFVGEGTIIREGDCVWSRYDGNWTRRSTSANDEGYRINDSMLAIGTQREIANDWFLGASAGYGFGKTTADRVSSDNDTYVGGVALKYNHAPWQISVAIHGGIENSDTSRWTPLGTAKSDVDAYFVSARLRAAYEFSMPDWYVRPYADFDLNHVRQKAYEEEGAGPYDLAVSGNSTTSFMVSPMLEFGSRSNFEQATLRSYIGTGMSFLSGGDVTTSLSLKRFDLTPFSLKSGMPTVYGNLSAGLELVTLKGFEVKAEYGLRFAKDYSSQSLAIRGAYRF